MATVALATEDVLSESVGLRLLAVYLPQEIEPLLLRKNGAGYLRSNISKWAQLARRHPVVVLTDLDRLACPVDLLASWQIGLHSSRDLFLRIAVREVESWLMADHQALRKLIGPRGALPAHPDEIAEPKQYLLRMAERAPRKVRSELLVPAGAFSSQGMGYNSLLSNLIRTEWSPQRAALRSPSLQRTCDRLEQLGRRLGRTN